MQNVANVLKGWYQTSILPEPEFRTQEATHRQIEEHVAELAQIVARAKKNGVYLKAPNGKPTNLTVERWALVRTKAFKQTFGDWEHAAQVAKFLNSEPIVATGEEWKGKYKLDRNSAKKYIKDSLRRTYVNKDTGATIEVTRKSTKAANRDVDIQLSLVPLLPQLLENAIYLGEESNEKDKRGFSSFRYYVTRVKIGDTDYVVRLTTGTDRSIETYYDLSLTEIKKGELADQRDSLEALVYNRRGPLSGREDRRLIFQLQGDFSAPSNLVDENGEPKSAEVEAFESKHSDIQLPQLRWIKQNGEVFGWFNQNTNAIVLCEGHNTSTALEAFWHATFCFTKTTAPRLYFKMLAFARKTPKSIKYASKKFYPELKAGSEAWFDKLGAMRFAMEYADKIQKSLNNEKSLFDNLLRVFSGDKVNLAEIGRRPPEKAVAALAHAFASGKHLA